ncbi:acetyltransferase [Fodinibius halophilus]|uniref:Acetyltransferase n=1 Tax=Fodinibius halophilus TaxID=1736908 RepID=A0A6M1STU1_9BACT|nr:acetyltransferase [Fodinibius halophilus]NGP87358.1 acetyltransferase [Fodinibius halophilus]
MAKVVVFGLQDTAELAHYYLQNDSYHDVVGFTVHEEYMGDEEFRGLPVVPFEEVNNYFSPSKFRLFAPMTARNMNRNREKVYLEGKEKGYDYVTYLSSRVSYCDNDIGENCFILEDNTLQPFTKIGNNVVLWSGNHIGHHGEIKDHVFFTSHVVMSGHCVIESNCFFGVNAAIRDYSTIRKGTLLAMGASLVSQETEEWGIYVGNPAKRKGSKPSYEVY